MSAVLLRLARTARWIDALNEWSGRVFAWLTLLMVVVTFAIVILRYVFGLGWIAMQESVTYMHALVFLIGAGYTLRHDGHVRVDIFYQKMSPRRQAWIDMLGTGLLLVPVALYIGVVSWEYVASSWALREGSREAGGLPGVFLLKSTILVFAVLLLLQGIAQLLHNLLFLLGDGQRTEHAAREHGEI
jgi:TRAP-type mannitol/chloroaromatic compound transport system permease small subunit